MNDMRLLLPFSYGVHTKAIDHVLFFVKAAQATLVVVTFIPFSAEVNAGNARLERIEQARDFQETVAFKAVVSHIDVEFYETYTSDIPASVVWWAKEQRCDGIVLISDRDDFHFFLSDEAEQVRRIGEVPLYRLQMLPQKKTQSNQSLFSQVRSLLSNVPYAENL